MKRIYIIGLTLLAAATLYAGLEVTVFSKHAVKELPTIDETFVAAKKLFVTNNWNKVVITLERDFQTDKETFKVEGYKLEGRLME